MLRLVAELEKLSSLRLSSCPGITTTGLEVFGKLNALKALGLSNTLSNDCLLQLAGQLPQLVTLSIHHDRSAIYNKQLSDSGVSVVTGLGRITDAGVNHLANAKQLKFLELSSVKTTDQEIGSQERHN